MTASAFLREKLRNAALAITDGDGPMQERLRSAYLYNLSGLQEEDFPDAEGLAAYMDIRAALSKFGEAMEGAGDIPTTLWMMSDEQAADIGERIVALARRYGEI